MSLAGRVGRAIIWGQAGRVAEATVFFLFYLFLARVLGPTSYGIFAVGMSLAGACVFLTLFGLGPETLGRFVPEVAAGCRRDRARHLLGMLMAVRGVAILAAAALLLVFSRRIGARFHFPLAVESLAIVSLVFAARSIFDLLTFFSAGLLDLKRVAAAKLIAAVVAPVLFLFFWFRHASGVNAAWLATAGSALAGIIVLAVPYLAPAGASRTLQADALPLRRILAFGLFAWATNFFVYVLGDNMDVLLLGWLVPDRAAIGQYAVGAKIVFSLTTLSLGWVTLVSVASLSEAWQRGGVSRLASVVEAQWKLGVLCLVAPLLLLLRFAREIVNIFYSPAYAPSVAVIQVLCGLMICGVGCGFSIQGGILYTLDHERIACAAVGLVAVFNIVGEILLVRRMGIMGAAWATGISYVLAAIVCTVAGAFFIPFHFPWQFIGSVAVAAGAGVASTLWLQPASVISLLAAGALCAGVFFGCLAVLKPLTGEDSAGLHRVNGLLGTWSEKLFVNIRATVKEG
jgi:O-antigen/teichoic acid export membrane protein